MKSSELNLTTTDIKIKLITDVKWLYRGILAIYEMQTLEEQSVENTLESNGVGFNGSDANLLSSFAKQLLQRGELSEKQRILARSKMVKYSSQLLKIAKSKEEIKSIR